MRRRFSAVVVAVLSLPACSEDKSDTEATVASYCDLLRESAQLDRSLGTGVSTPEQDERMRDVMKRLETERPEALQDVFDEVAALFADADASADEKIGALNYIETAMDEWKTENCT